MWTLECALNRIECGFNADLMRIRGQVWTGLYVVNLHVPSVDKKSRVNYRKYVNYGRSRSVRVRRGVDMAGSKPGFLSKLYEYGRGTFKKRPSASDVVSNQPTVGVCRTWSLYRFSDSRDGRCSSTVELVMSFFFSYP